VRGDAFCRSRNGVALYLQFIGNNTLKQGDSMVNKNLVNGNWNEIKGRIQGAWGKLTDDELETAKGDVTKVAGLIQQKYGSMQEDARKKLNDWFAGKDNSSKP
jgi:uncharacterized protein YjbJ (UPF0337 family)